MHWLDANFFWRGASRVVGDQGTEGMPRRHRRSCVLSESLIPPGRVIPLRAIPLTEPLPPALSPSPAAESPAGCAACCAGCGAGKPMAQHRPAVLILGFGMGLACAPSWISSEKFSLWHKQATFLSVTCIPQKLSVAKLTFLLSHHPLVRIKHLQCITTVSFGAQCKIFLLETLSLIANTAFDFSRTRWSALPRSSLVILSYLGLTHDFVINEYLSPGAGREGVGTVTPVEAAVLRLSAQRPLQQNSWANRIMLWREKCAEKQWDPSHFSPPCGHSCSWEHMACSVNW